MKYNMLRRPVLFKGKFFKITASYGIAVFPQDGRTVDDLVKKADMAQYASKSQGRNLVTLASEIRSRQVVRTFMSVLMAVLYIALFILSRPLLEKYWQLALTSLMPNLEAQYRKLDTVVLKDGTVVRGEIAQETHQSLTVNRKVKEHIISMYINKSEVQERTYGSQTTSRKKFDRYIKENPNPHSL